MNSRVSNCIKLHKFWHYSTDLGTNSYHRDQIVCQFFYRYLITIRIESIWTTSISVEPYEYCRYLVWGYGQEPTLEGIASKPSYLSFMFRGNKLERFLFVVKYLKLRLSEWDSRYCLLALLAKYEPIRMVKGEKRSSLFCCCFNGKGECFIRLSPDRWDRLLQRVGFSKRFLRCFLP